MSRDTHSRVQELEDQLIVAKIVARRLWAALSVRVERAAAMLLDDGVLALDARRTIDAAFDAAQIVWERHRILIEPCRRIMDAPRDALTHYPTQPEMYLARMPGGEERTIDRAQLMMMAGQDPDAA